LLAYLLPHFYIIDVWWVCWTARVFEMPCVLP